VSPGDPQIPGMAEVPSVTGTSRVPETDGAAPNHPPTPVRGDAMLDTRPIGPDPDTPPYQPGEIIVRLRDSRPLVVTAVHDFRDIALPGQEQWLIDAEGPRILCQPYTLTEVRPIHETDTRTASRRQLVRRLIARHGATDPSFTDTSSAGGAA
jgi:hypothetical protein